MEEHESNRNQNQTKVTNALKPEVDKDIIARIILLIDRYDT